MRVFIAVTLDKDTKSHLKNMADKLSEHIKSARYTYIDNYHITLVFIGETDVSGLKKIVHAVDKTAGDTMKFKLMTSKVGNFKKNNRHIVYCELKKSKKLNDIYLSLMKNLSGDEIELREGKFTPHITLAREAVPNNQDWDGINDEKEIIVSSISVMESTRINGKLTYIPRHTAYLGGTESDK